MEQIRYTVILDITDNGCFNTGWRLKQGDGQNIVLDVKVTNNGENYEAENPPRIVFKRPDGYSVIGQMDALTEDFYTYTIVGNEIAVAGNVLMDVKFGEDEDRTSTASCKFEVIPDTIGQSSGGSGIYDNTLAELVEESRINVLLAESYTKGGTGIRSGEETDNARYYKDKAAETVDAVMREYLIENVDYLKNQNRFNPSKVTNGKINIENGNIISDSNYITSDYVPFDLTKLNNDRVKFGASSYGGDDLIVQLYDNQKRNIRTLFYGSLGTSWIGTKFMEEVSIPENDVLRYDLVYVRYSLQKDSINPILGNRALFDYSTFGDYKSNKVLSEDLTQFIDDGYLPKNKWKTNPLNLSASVGVNFDNPLKQGTYIIKTFDASTSGVFNFFGVTPSGNEAILSGASWANAINGIVFTTTKDYESLRFYSGANFSGKVQIEEGTEAHPYTPYAPSNIELIENFSQLTEEKSGTLVAGANINITEQYCIKKGNVVTVSASFSASANVNSWTTVLNIPRDFLPKVDCYITGYNFTQNIAFVFRLDKSTGQIQTRASILANNTLGLVVTYVV